MSVSVDRKPERAVQAKIRDIKRKVIILIGWKPERAVYAKVKDSRKGKVTASNRHHPLGAYLLSKNLQSEASKTVKFEVIRENRVIKFNVPLHFKITMFRALYRSVELRHWRATIQSIKFELLPLYLKFSLILFSKISPIPFLMIICWRKILKTVSYLLKA